MSKRSRNVNICRENKDGEFFHNRDMYGEELDCRQCDSEPLMKNLEYCNGICSSSEGPTTTWWLCNNRRTIQKDEKEPYFCKRWHSGQKRKDGVHIHMTSTSVKYYYNNNILEPDKDRKLTFTDPMYKEIYDNTEIPTTVVNLIRDYATPEIRVFSTQYAVAVVWEDGTLTTWDKKHTIRLGFENVILDEAILSGIQRVDIIYSNNTCFVAKLMNGSFVSWGFHERTHIPIESIQEKLVDVEKIYSNDNAFVAKLRNGSVVAWGEPISGGQIPEDTQNKLVNVEEIYSNDLAFVAKLKNGSVVAWGHITCGGTIPENTQTLLVDVETVFSFDGLGFVAKLKDGSVVAWGNQKIDIPEDKQKLLVHVEKIYWNFFRPDPAFAVKLVNGSLVVWGDNEFEISADKQTQLVDVEEIYSNESAFVAKLKDGTIISWGTNFQFDDNKLVGVTNIYSDNSEQFVIKLDDGSALQMYKYSFSTKVNQILQSEIIGNIHVCPEKKIFAAELGDYNVLVWYPHQSPKILHNVKKIHVTEFQLVFETDNGNLNIWGDLHLNSDDYDWANDFQRSRLRRIKNIATL